MKLYTIRRLETEKAEQRGERRGMNKGKLTLLKRQIKIRFPKAVSWVEDRLQEANEEKLNLWTERILTVNSAEELFRD